MSIDVEKSQFSSNKDVLDFKHVSPFYCDYNATTPVPDGLADMAASAYRSHWLNQSASYGAAAAETKLARLLRQRFSGLTSETAHSVLCGSATEAINLAMSSLARNLGESGKIIITDFEHAAVKQSAQHWFNGRVITVSAMKIVGCDFSELRSAVTDAVNAAIFLQAASNESGLILPVQAIRAEFPDELLFVDASQLLGKSPEFLDILEGVDGAVFSPHKFYGPKGIGVLNWGNQSGVLHPLIMGGGQESGFRSGTENGPLIYLAARWFEMLPALMEDWDDVTRFRDEFELQVLSRFPSAFVLGADKPRLGNTSAICFPGVVSESSLAVLDASGIMASSGSACHSGTREPSQSYLAMGLSWDHARCVVRFSFGLPNLKGTPESLAEKVSLAIHKASR